MTMTVTRYTTTATAMKTWKTNGVLLRNRQIHGEFTVIPSSENITKAPSESTVVPGPVVPHVYGENKVGWNALKVHSWLILSLTLCAGTHGMNWPNCAISHQMYSLFTTVKLIWHRWTNLSNMSGGHCCGRHCRTPYSEHLRSKVP